MATFLSLPNELKLQVIEIAAPDDIENLALCCKLVYDLAGETLRQHKADKERYSRLHFSLFWDTNDGTLDDSIICDMVESRRLRLYPEFVTVEDYKFPSRHSTSMHRYTRREIVGTSNGILKDLESPYIDRDEMVAWYSRIRNGKGRIGNIKLLTLLPNLKHICIWDHGDMDSDFSNMIYDISRINQETFSPCWEKFSLMKLHEVSILSDYRIGPAVNSIRVLEAFMTLPSLQIVRGTHLGAGYTFDTFDPDYCSNVTEIHFRDCTLSTTQLENLFRHLKALKVFSYDHASIWRGPRKCHVPGQLLDALCRYAKKTLIFLNYTADSIDDIEDHRVPYAATPRSFEALKRLRISRLILITKAAPRPLVDDLPCSLEELELVSSFNTTEAEQMFEGMLVMKRERCPNLRLVVFENAVPFDDEVVTAYERIGLVLDWRDTGTNRTQKAGQNWLGGIECLRSSSGVSPRSAGPRVCSIHKTNSESKISYPVPHFHKLAVAP